mmetsp:Transcript_6926/g.10963  ORF Transcript_6926/g.10963 Transcript_6926/m.10963 type:complete len:365 (+) Transcript_6926:246-1340(+)
MKGAVVDGKGGISFRDDMERPTCRDASWCVIRVSLAGVCGTDLEMLKGYKGDQAGMVIGHEFVGEIYELGSDHGSQWKVGDRVVGEINVDCGSSTCEMCCSGGVAKRNHCMHRKCLGIFNLNGCFAEFISLPLRNLYKVDMSIPDTVAVFMEPLAAACRILEQFPDMFTKKKQPRIGVVGDGRLGLLIGAALEAALRQTLRSDLQTTITVIGRHQHKLDLLRASHLPGSHLETLQVKNTEGLSNIFDYVVEATGSSGGLSLATELVKPLGTIVLKSTCSPTSTKPSLETQAQNNIVVKELHVVGSRCGPFPLAVSLLESTPWLGTLLGSMIDATFPIEEIKDAFERAETKGTLKVQIKFESKCS